eukprot:CAMPEP_0183723298 /NCGR_PEP_ID=MMETSP0737-20130205/14918_1 /TAXON_ID=385413 /ORGANISM="Thalassiosira miniscula, Strain CCMP1093" /LENGTH=558 /DNA_ID=CAMNT_0025953559 /DNA_START=60 /DNA_END=1736 /DNA_ORIENTATION=-
MLAPSFRFVLGVAPFLPSSFIQSTAFVLPSALPGRISAGSTLAYGPSDDGDEEKDVATPRSPFPSDKFQKQMENDLDPACDIDDEDCLAFSSLDDQPLVFNSNANEDPLCDPGDIDCQAFLPKTYLHSDTTLAAELKTRSNSIQNERIDHNWRNAHCPTRFVKISSSDWVRRVAMEWPLAVCGGARGGVYLVNLEEDSILGEAEGAHIVQVAQGSSNPGGVNTNTAKKAMEKLYGKLDGGGVVAVAIHGDLIASSGREGSVRLWKYVNFESFLPPIQRGGEVEKGGKLIPLGSLPGLEKTIVTSLKFDSNHLWAAAYDGTVHAYNITGYDDSNVQFPPRKPLFQTDFMDSVLDMQLCEELKLGVCATADGSAALFSLEDGQFFVGIMLFEQGVVARSVSILKHKSGAGYSVLCGGSDGVIHRIPLNINPTTGRVDKENPFAVSETTDTSIKPKHTGPVMCMASPCDDKFVTGGQDGAIRVWECAEVQSEAKAETDESGEQQTNEQKLHTKCLYALTGYKLWLGSACTDGKRLVSDGGENSVIIRDFSRQPGSSGKASL